MDDPRIHSRSVIQTLIGRLGLTLGGPRSLRVRPDVQPVLPLDLPGEPDIGVFQTQANATTTGALMVVTLERGYIYRLGGATADRESGNVVCNAIIVRAPQLLSPATTGDVYSNVATVGDGVTWTTNILGGPWVGGPGDVQVGVYVESGTGNVRVNVLAYRVPIR